MKLLNKLKPKRDLKWQSKKVSKLLKKLFSFKITKIFLGSLITIIAIPFIIYFVFKPKKLNKINYGVTFSNKYATQLGLDWQDAYLKTLDDLNVKNIRLVAYWDEVEPKNDSYDFSKIKWQLDEAEKRNVNVIMTIGRKVPRYPECYAPTWWVEIHNADIRQQELLEYLKVSVNELKSYKNIVMWQVENEPFWPFGECVYDFKNKEYKEEVNLVRSLDSRGILTQASGEGELLSWRTTYKLGDYLGISMYRKIWYDFWKILGGRFIYFKYPLPYWTYPIKAGLVGVPTEKIIITELQSEPWGPGINSELSNEEKNKSMSRKDFLATISYAQKAGFSDIYLWGVEWWLWEREINNNPFYWNTTKAIFN